MSMVSPQSERPMRWRFLQAGIALALPILLAIGMTRDPSRLPSALVGHEMPALAIPYLDRDGTLTASALEGQPLILNFWASWCTSCREEHDDLVRLGLRGAASGEFRVVGINYRDNPDNARVFLAREGAFPYPSGYDGSGRTGIDFGVYGMPETFFC